MSDAPHDAHDAHDAHDESGSAQMELQMVDNARPRQPAAGLSPIQRAVVAHGGMYPAAWEEGYTREEADAASPAEIQAAFEAVGEAAPTPTAGLQRRPSDVVEVTLRCTRATAERLQRAAEKHPTARSCTIRELD